jgi:hypothetical protein
MFKKIQEMTDVKLVTLESSPPKLLITASGVVPTSGWGKGELIEYLYIAPPTDGYYEFDFVGEAPAPGVSVKRESEPITATFILNSIPKDLKGIKVYASSNSRKEAYEDSSSMALEMIVRVGN